MKIKSLSLLILVTVLLALTRLADAQAPNSGAPATPAAAPNSEQKAPAAPAAAAPANDLNRLATEAVQALASGKASDVEKNLDPNMQKAFPPGKLATVWQQLVTQTGPFQKVEKIQPMNIRLVVCTFEKGKLAANIVFDANKKISGLQLLPPSPDLTIPPGPIPSDEFSTLAGKVIDALIVKKDAAAVFQQFDPAMQKAIPANKLTQIQQQTAAQLGAFKQTDGILVMDARVVTCKFEKGALDATVVFNGEKKIAGLTFAPPQASSQGPNQTQEGGDGKLFTEQEVVVGAGGEWALRGTLTLPTKGGPSPAVVLVHGSGPQDRDETIGPNKPFRDLAWGLAGRGIAVLRYEKRTKEYLMKCSESVKPITPKEETVDDALAAVALLRGMKEIDAKRIVIAGHSLGGMLAPRIAERDPSIAGLAILAGTTRSVEDVILEQVTYLASLDPDTPRAVSDLRIEKVKRQVDLIKSLSADKPSSEVLILAASPQYWLDLRNYHPAETARKLTLPMLIIQGERDYQVTMDDFKGWRDVLSTRANVTFKLYPSLNHLFIKGEGKSTPTEYESIGYVAPEVVNDMADWIKRL